MEGRVVEVQVLEWWLHWLKCGREKGSKYCYGKVIVLLVCGKGKGLMKKKGCIPQASWVQRIQFPRKLYLPRTTFRRLLAPEVGRQNLPDDHGRCDGLKIYVERDQCEKSKD